MDMVNGQGGWIYRRVEIKMTHAANARIDLSPFPRYEPCNLPLISFLRAQERGNVPVLTHVLFRKDWRTTARSGNPRRIYLASWFTVNINITKCFKSQQKPPRHETKRSRDLRCGVLLEIFNGLHADTQRPPLFATSPLRWMDGRRGHVWGTGRSKPSKCIKHSCTASPPLAQIDF